ncbi:unnamed protein product [Pseudo-nitzschia multistriata]|uniref:DUF501 domain-containing protein n=1 Tax=Pseudo-nitzschia multistriata TaxID=183589 RepID=A0A448ZFV9_9STRA|nr:unnamed protein product [Pseudo-nitzschia multistriata]
MDLKSGVSPSPSTSRIETVEREENTVARHVPIKGRRRNLGRQARKRRKKYLEIEAAASAFVAAAAAVTACTIENQSSNPESTVLESATNPQNEKQKSGSSNIASTNCILPTDRSYILDDVRRRTMLSENDRRDLIQQLGYLPGNALQVMARVEDAFSTEDLQHIIAATVAGSKTSSKNSPNATATMESSTNCKEIKTNRKDPGMTARMVQTMMKEPLVIKLYPLALRDESSSTKRRRKRRREEKEDLSTSSDKELDVICQGTSKTVREDQSIHPAASAPTHTIPLMEPFPTIYWVTHPLIKALISKLELDKVNVRFEQRLLDEIRERKAPEKCKYKDNSSSSSLESMKCAHKSYGRERRELLSEQHREYVKKRRWYEDSISSNNHDSKKMTPSKAPFGDGCGVAGIRNPRAVKCLHAHAAHYWSGNRDNLVGYWVEQELKKRRT